MQTLIDNLGITLPIIQAPMAGVQDWRLCAAVSKAGGLGSLPCGLLSPEQIAVQVDNIRHATSKPFNLNFFCHSMPDVTDDTLETWQAQFSEDYRRFHIQPEHYASGAIRRPFDADVAELVKTLAPPVVSFHFGLPDEALLETVRRSGALILSSATTVEEAVWLQNQGVDAVILQGIEAGGHRGMFLTEALDDQLSTAALLAACTTRLSCPIIAAGGIANAQDVKHTLSMGADAVQIGTAYLLCDEANTSAVHRQALQQGDHNTVITNVFSGRPARGIVNGMINRLGAINNLAPPFPYASLATTALRGAAEKVGNSDYSPLWAGTNISGCKSISAAQMTLTLADKSRL